MVLSPTPYCRVSLRSLAICPIHACCGDAPFGLCSAFTLVLSLPSIVPRPDLSTYPTGDCKSTPAKTKFAKTWV